MDDLLSQGFVELKGDEELELEGGLYSWEIAVGIVATLYVIDRAYTCGKHAGEVLYYMIYEE